MASSSKIGDSDFTIEWLEKIIVEKLGTEAKITDFSISEVGTGRGYMSQILIVKMTWDSTYQTLPKSVAVKIPGIKKLQKRGEGDTDELSKEMFHAKNMQEYMNTLVRIVHTCEVAVYGTFESNPPNLLKVPKCYHFLDNGADQQGVLVLEDLSHCAGVTLVQGLPLHGILEVAEQIAYLQAYSLTNDTWKNDMIGVTMGKFDNPAFPNQCEINKTALTTLKTQYPALFDPLSDKAMELLQSMSDITYVYSLNQKMGLPDVFVHGDFHCQNLLFEPDEASEKKIGKLVAIIDFQACHAGNIMEDIVRLFVSSVSNKIRRDHWKDVLKHYYECLEKSLGHKPPFGFDKVIESYKRSFKGGVNMLIRTFVSQHHEAVKKEEGEKAQEILLKCKALLEDELEYEAEFKD